jgi:hypothetical protein
VIPAIVYAKSKTDHFRRDLRTTSPGLDGTGLGRLLAEDLFGKIFVYIWAFLE